MVRIGTEPVKQHEETSRVEEAKREKEAVPSILLAGSFLNGPAVSFLHVMEVIRPR